MTTDTMPNVRRLTGGAETAEDYRRIGALLQGVAPAEEGREGRSRLFGAMLLDAAATADGSNR